jgi:pantothenate kinase
MRKQVESQINYSQWAHLVLEKTFPERPDHRYMLGIVGSPASGKSMFANSLVQALNETTAQQVAVVVPMDGFHLANKELKKRKLLHLKGVPETFDAEGYVKCIENLSTERSESVFCPLFERKIEASRKDAIEVKPENRIVVSEGNYLLLDQAPWNKLRSLFDEIWFLEAEEHEIMPRLVQRHLDGGKDEKAAHEKIASTDMPNAKLIEATKNRADRIIKLSE